MNLNTKAVCLDLDFGRFGNSRQVPGSQVDVGDANPTLIKHRKVLLTSPEYDAIGTFDSAVTSWVRARCLPCPFGKGLMLVPISTLPKVEDYLKTAVITRCALVEEFLGVYLSYIARARVDLGSLFAESDYPSDVESKYRFSWRYVSLEAPEVLQGLYPELFAAEQAKVQAEWSNTARVVESALCDGLADLIAKMEDRLQPGRTFRDSLVSNMREFLELFADRNITDDSKLSELVRRAESVLGDVTPEVLRQNTNRRAEVLAGLQAVGAGLQTVAVERGRMVPEVVPAAAEVSAAGIDVPRRSVDSPFGGGAVVAGGFEVGRQVDLPLF